MYKLRGYTIEAHFKKGNDKIKNEKEWESANLQIDKHLGENWLECYMNAVEIDVEYTANERKRNNCKMDLAIA